MKNNYTKHLTSFKKFVKLEKRFQEILYPTFSRSKKDRNKFFINYTSYSGIDRNTCNETYVFDDDLKTFIKTHWSSGYQG